MGLVCLLNAHSRLNTAIRSVIPCTPWYLAGHGVYQELVRQRLLHPWGRCDLPSPSSRTVWGHMNEERMKAIHELVEMGKERGYVTHEELDEALPASV